jgi:hypothetical protein
VFWAGACDEEGVDELRGCVDCGGDGWIDRVGEGEGAIGKVQRTSMAYAALLGIPVSVSANSPGPRAAYNGKIKKIAPEFIRQWMILNLFLVLSRWIRKVGFPAHRAIWRCHNLLEIT